MVYRTRNLCRYVLAQEGSDRISRPAEEDSEILNWENYFSLVTI